MSDPGPRITSTRSASEATYMSGRACPKMPAHWGCPSRSMSTWLPPPTPRTLTAPAAPEETPKPVMPFWVTNRPGTCCERTGSSDDSLLFSIWLRVTTERVIGRMLRCTRVRVE